MHLHFLGCGDAFGSGGRLNACFLVDRGGDDLLIDCGASAMIAIRRAGVDPNRIAAILISHLHGDHFGGLPFFILDAQLVSKRDRPLIVAGPKGVAARVETLMEAMFPGSWTAERKFPIEFVELDPARPAELLRPPACVTSFLMRHASGAPALGLRIACDGRTVAYTGDTEWVGEIVPLGAGADVLIAEAYTFERKTRFHLDYATLAARLPQICARRVVLTHMSPDMLARSPSDFGDCLLAADGAKMSAA